MPRRRAVGAVALSVWLRFAQGVAEADHGLPSARTLTLMRMGLKQGGAPMTLLEEFEAAATEPPAAWWRGQRSRLAAAERRDVALAASLRQLPRLSFASLLDALVPEERRTRFAINFGAGDGKTHDPVYPLFRDLGYGGLAVEADPELLPALTRNLDAARVRLEIARLEPASVEALLRHHRVPTDADALKVDIDSVDGALTAAVLRAGWRPKVLAIELNPDVPPPFVFEFLRGNFSRETSLAHHGVYGASAEALYTLVCEEMPYSVVGFELVSPQMTNPRDEHNMWFVRNDLLGRAPQETLVSWFGMTQLYWAQVSAFTSPWHCLHLHTLLGFCPITALPLLAEMDGWPALPAALQSAAVALLADSPSSAAGGFLMWLRRFLRRYCPSCRLRVAARPLQAADFPELAGARLVPRFYEGYEPAFVVNHLHRVLPKH